MAMRELPFRARVSDSFIEMLKQASANATAEWPGVLPCLCADEKRQNADCGEPREKRINFEHPIESVAINRLAPRRAPPILITERVWVVCFNKREYAPQTTFNLEGLKVHIDEQAQAELKGATLNIVNGKIVATYELIQLLLQLRAYYAANPIREVANVRGIAFTATACEAAMQAIRRHRRRTGPSARSAHGTGSISR